MINVGIINECIKKIKNSYDLDIVIEGVGGQGILVAGTILSYAAMLEGFQVAQTISYAPLARGAFSNTGIKICKGEIIYPHVENLDILIAMSQNAYDMNIDKVKKKGIIIVDKDLVKHVKSKCLKIPLSKLAREKVGFEISATMIALGYLVKITEIVSIQSLLKAIDIKAPKPEINKKAAELGYSLDGVEKMLTN